MKILMVCLGNICRSPLAEGIMKNKLMAYGIPFEIDSAGTGAWHIGQSPDKRSVQVARQYGIDISGQRARQFKVEDFEAFDFIFAMDQNNRRDILSLTANGIAENVHLFLEFAGMGCNDVPDPWFGNETDFEAVYKLLDDACTAAALKLISNND